MSKLYTKTSRQPLIVEKQLAEKLNYDFVHKTVQPDTILSISHSFGKTTLTFGDITRVDVTNNDNDFKSSRVENTEKTYSEPPKFESETLEEKQEFNKKSKMIKEAMGWK